MPISFRGSLTLADAYAAIALAQPLGNKIATWVVRSFYLGALIYLTWLTFYSYRVGEPNLARLALAGALFFLLPIGFFVGRELWYRRLARQLCRAGKGLYAPTTGAVDDQAVHSQTDEGNASLNWSAFCGYRASETVAVLYLNYPASYVIMARTKFGSDEDWHRFLRIAGKNLVRR